MRAVGPVKGALPQLLSDFLMPMLLAFQAKHLVADCGQNHGFSIVIFELACVSSDLLPLQPVAQKAPSRYAALLVTHLERQGKDCSAVLQQFGVSRRTLNHPRARMDRKRLLEFGQHLLAMAGRDGSGLDVGAALCFDHPPELGEAMRACATVGEAMRCMARHHVVLTQAFGFRFRVDGGWAELRWFPVHPVPWDIVGFTFDVAMGSVHAWLKRALRRSPPAYVVHCSLPVPLHRARYDVLSTAQLHFGEGGLPNLRILVPAHVMDVQLATANAALLAQAEASLLLLRPGSDGPQDRVAWLRQMVRNTRAHQPSQAELADVLGVSVSTLSRQLAAQGLSFRKLANAVRHEQACELLKAGQLSVQDIAQQLGYAEPANFVRAFRAQAGISPGACARQWRPQASPD